MKNNTAVSTSPLSSKAKSTIIKKSAKNAKTAKKSKSVLTDNLNLSETMQERLEKFQKVLKHGVATRSELKAANKKLFGKKSSPSYITKNKAFKTDVTGLYSLVAQKGAAATAAAVKTYLKEKESASAAAVS